jgi:hypothetical protein
LLCQLFELFAFGINAANFTKDYRTMPNHVTTRCTVTGPVKDITAFRDLMFVSGKNERDEPDTNFDFEKIIPEPDAMKLLDELVTRLAYDVDAETLRGMTIFDDKSYWWRVHNWGTKWNSYGFDLVSDDPLEFVFDTAWAFPCPVFIALAQNFPALHFRCFAFDEMWIFAGQGYFKHDEQQWELCDATAELWEKVYGDLCDPTGSGRP